MSKQVAKYIPKGKPAAGGFKREAVAKPKNVIFNAGDAAGRLSSLREEAVAALYQKAVAEGEKAAAEAGQPFDASTVEVTEDEILATHWWTPAFKIDWASTRKGGNGTQWVSTEFRSESGVAGSLVVRINGERHCGQIMPITDEGVSELAARTKNPKVQIKKRDKKPSVQIQKWAGQVKTLEDGITLQTDEEGRPIVPSDDQLSAYYQLAELVDEAFYGETKERIQRGLDYFAVVRAEKLAQKGAFKAQHVLEADAKANPPRFPGDMILGADSVAEIKKMAPVKEQQEILLRGTIAAPLVKIARLVQTTIGASSTNNAGLPLPNPMTRIAMNFDQTTGLSQLRFFDKDKPYMAQNKQQYDVGKVDEDPINAENVHMFIRSRATLDGIVNMDSICFSNMGISMPVKADVLVVKAPSGREVSLDDVYDDDGMGGGYSAGDALQLEGGEEQLLLEGGEAQGEPEPEPEPEKPAPPKPAPASSAPKPSAASSAPKPPAASSAAKPPAKAVVTRPAAAAAKPPAKVAAKPGAAATKAPTEEDYGALLEDLGAS